MEALRADYKADFVRVTRTTDRLGNALLEIVDIVKEQREDLDRVSLRSQAQMEGLESLLRVEMNEVQKDLTIVSGVVTSHLNHSAPSSLEYARFTPLVGVGARTAGPL